MRPLRLENLLGADALSESRDTGPSLEASVVIGNSACCQSVCLRWIGNTA